MILLQAHNISKLFGGDVLFQDVKLEIKTQSRIALVGQNGAGKSTLLKIIANLEEPDTGQINKAQQLKMAYLDQNTGLASDKTIFSEMESVFTDLIQTEKKMHILEEKMALDPTNQDLLIEYDKIQHYFSENNGYGYQAEIKAILHGFKFPDSYFDTPISSLSGGQKTRLALAKMLLEKPDLLILDEPTNHLDIETLSWLENYLTSYQGAILIVSHDRYFLDKVATEIYELTNHTIKHYVGNYSKYLMQREQDLLLQEKAYNKQQEEIAKMKTFIAKNIARSSTTKRAQSRQKQLDKMEKLDKPIDNIRHIKLQFPISQTSGNKVLNLESGAIGYDNQILSQNINLNVQKNDAIAIVGPNGIGKSTLLKSIIGQIPLIKSHIEFGTNVHLGYYDQEHNNLNRKKDVLHEIWDEHPTMDEKDIRTHLASFLFQGEDIDKYVYMLSGGERARLSLAKLALEQNNTLILDEPTNHLDLQSKEKLEQALQEFAGTLIFVSHDRYFINNIATKIIELSPEKSTLYLGNYDYYVTKKEEERLAQLDHHAKNKLEPTKDTSSASLSREEQKIQRQLKRKIQQLEEQIATDENQLQQLETTMMKEEYQQDSQKLHELDQERQKIQTQIEQNLQTWEELSLQIEE